MRNFYDETIDFLSKNHKLFSDVISVEMSFVDEKNDNKITTYSSDWDSFAAAAKSINYEQGSAVESVINPCLVIIGKNWEVHREPVEAFNDYEWVLVEAPETEFIRKKFTDIDLINPDFIRDLNKDSHKYLKFTREVMV